MISYQWDSQSIMVKVKDKLRQAGYKVWMDVEHMSKNIQMIGYQVKTFLIDPKSTIIFPPENVVCFFTSAAYIQVHFRLGLFMEAANMDPDQTTHIGPI